LNHTPRITVVVPTLGRLATLARVLEHLDSQTVSAADYELIIVADAKLSEVAAIDSLVQGRSYRVQRLQADVPGASSARNAGWRAARAPLLLFIDDDILPDPGLIEQHLLWHQRSPAPEVGVLGHVRWASELPVTPFMRWLEHGIQFNYPSMTGRETVWGNFYTANVSVKRVVVERSGGFDEQRLPYGYEDLDLALRMHRRDGFRLLYNRAATAEHLHAMDIEFWKRRVARIAVSERQFVELHPEIPAYFHALFTSAAARRRVGHHGELLARLTPRWVPLLGPHVWSRVDLYYRQALAEPFLEAWRTRRPGAEPQPSIEPVSSGGSPPGGPK
jgi:glycosyltransferase involved in cell wall biosynthesis